MFVSRTGPQNSCSISDLPVTLMLGGLVYRIGPDPARDVVAFCGPGNLGQMTANGILLGHAWLESGSDYIDFSCGDWRASMGDHLMIPNGTTLQDGTIVEDNLGPPQWEVSPPDYMWEPRVRVLPIPGVHTPDLGHAYYTGWTGAKVPPLDDIVIPWNRVSQYFVEACLAYQILPRAASRFG